MQVAVCDDERLAREHITLLIKKEAEDAEVLQFSSAEEMLKSERDFDISFLDIEMEGLSGIELARRIRKVQERRHKWKSPIIFVTSYGEYMAAAFDVNAFHYLVKPINEEKFAEVFNRAIREINSVSKRHARYIIIKSGDSKRKVLFKDIYYIESNNKKVAIHTSNGVLETYAKMGDLEKELGKGFFRSHRCYLVNLEKVSGYTSNSIMVTNGEHIFLANKRYSDFVKTYLRYAKNGGIVNV